MGDTKHELEEHLGGLLSEIDPEISSPDEEWKFDLTDDDKSRLSFIETLRESVYEFGGPKGVAKEYKATYDSAPAGSNTRARIIDRLVQAISDYGEDEELGDEQSIDALDAELRPIYQQELLERLPDELRAKVAEHLK